MTFDDAIKKACEQPTLLEALSWISVWECERVIPVAHKFLNHETPRDTDGKGWNTCFKYLIDQVMQQYTIKKLQGR